MDILTMTDEEKRVRIAEACGYTLKQVNFGQSYWAPCVVLISPEGKELLPASYWDTDKRKTDTTRWAQVYAELGKLLPDYLGSLDAMHEAEKVLAEWAMEYVENLKRITYDESPHQVSYDQYCCDLNLEWSGDCFSTARQRANAFLITINSQ